MTGDVRGGNSDAEAGASKKNDNRAIKDKFIVVRAIAAP
jgi:hypothetical protein